MKIKTKLVISFCIMLFVPIFLASLTIWGFSQIQVKNIEATYGIKNGKDYVWTNTLQLINRATKEDFEDLTRVAETDPDRFTDEEFLQEVQERLHEKSSFLTIRKAQKLIFQGQEDSALFIDYPDYGAQETEGSVSTYIDAEDQVLIKQIDFQFSDGDKGSAFIITSTKSVVPEVRNLVSEVVVAIFLILFLTAMLMIIWIYQSLVTPVRKLQMASDNIKEGNLDFQVDVSSQDEMGELCRSFEAMRQRLKDNAEEKIRDEKENRVLISNIAHDLKTPITAVKGYAEGIMDGVANTPEKLDKYIRTIYNKANEMDTLINELTLYAKIDTNRIPYNFAKINATEYFDDCIEEIGLDLESRKIGLAYYNYVDNDVLIIADPEQLRRVIHNIVGNSIKYMNKSQGMINIRVKDVGDFIQVEIEDNGRGISAVDLPYIFDRFYRADASRNSATGGSGIGLSIVKKIIEDHGGKIWATSKEDTGTVMYFVLRKYQEVYNE